MPDTELKKGQHISPTILSGGPYKITTLMRYSSGSIHGAIDIACPTGTELYAPFDGIVTAAMDGIPNNRPGAPIWSGKPSNWILLRVRLKTAYGKWQFATIFLQHLSPGLKVGIGSSVRAGQLLGYTGNSGNSTGPHLHAGAQWVTASRGSGAGTRYDHVNDASLRVWGPERFIFSKEVLPMAKWYKYSGKPSGSLRLPVNKYVNLDAQIPAPPSDGVEDRMVYLNVTPTWKLPKTDPMYWYQTAVIRVRWTRAGAKPDRTAYQTFVMTPWEETLITHTHWEKGKAGLGGRWSMRVRGMITGATVNTRYSKGKQE